MWFSPCSHSRCKNASFGIKWLYSFDKGRAEAPHRFDELAHVEAVSIADPVPSPNPALSEMKLDKASPRISGVDPALGLTPVAVIGEPVGAQNEQLLVGIDSNPRCENRAHPQRARRLRLRRTLYRSPTLNALPSCNRLTFCSLMRGYRTSSFGFVVMINSKMSNAYSRCSSARFAAVRSPVG